MATLSLKKKKKNAQKAAEFLKYLLEDIIHF